MLMKMDGPYRCHGTAEIWYRPQGVCTKDPIIEYRMEGSDMFDEMIRSIQIDSVKELLHIKKENIVVQRTQVARPIEASHGEGTVNKPKKRAAGKVGRNDPCHCGSGKKYKKCCGA